ncbi:MAG: formyltransferase family protein [Burkholderiaceae bacterium]
MKIMLVGQKWLGAQALNSLREAAHDVAAVAAPSPQDRLWASAVELRVPAVEVGKRLEAEHVPADTDLIVCAHAHCFISGAARKATRLGAIGYHPSLLPLHRGRDAIEWALRFGERVTGGSVYWMDDRADAGPVICQDWCFIRPEDTAETLWRRDLGPMGVKLLEQAVALIAQGSGAGREQDESLHTWEPALHMRKALSDRPNGA